MDYKGRNITVPIHREDQRILIHTHKNHLELISEFSKIVECKINT